MPDKSPAALDEATFSLLGSFLQGTSMVWTQSRFWALAVVLFLVAAQVHVCLEAGPARTPGHACQVCTSGGWAIISTHPAVEVAQWTLRLEVERSQAVAKSHRVEASAPRAPPHA